MSIDFRSEWTEGGYSSANDLRCENVRLREKLRNSENDAAWCKAMLREGNHRIKNSLQIVSSLMSLQARCETDGPARATLRAAAARIQAVASLHNALQAHDGAELVNLGAMLEGMGESLADMYGEERPITVQITAEHALVPGAIARPAAMAVSELVINALRHGFPHGRSGAILVTVLRTDNALRLVVADDGVGLPAPNDEGSGYGMKLVRMIAKQIGATLYIDRIKGARFSLVVPGAYALAGKTAEAAA